MSTLQISDLHASVVTDAHLRRDVIRRIEERIGMDAIEQQLTEVDG